MKKYLTIVTTFWQRGLTHRFTIFTYRIGEVGEIIVLILMWTAIYGKDTLLIRGFTLQEMITYVLMGNLFSIVTRNFLSNMVANEIKNGGLSMFLLKPVSYLHFAISREMGRIIVPLSMSFVSQIFIMLFFLDKIIINISALHLVLIIIMLALAFVSELFISYLVGLVAFWTEEVDGLYASVDRIKRFFSGGYFPLTLLPAALAQTSFLLPFAYSFFVPAQLYLKKIDLAAGARGLVVQLVWIALLYGIITVVWKRGLARYEGVGM